ncbi:cell division protein FtsX [Actinoplanes sp. HUAS TT8]|uniref:cell division protein FtsX n=1 Tax=Actinoplanes sp. HUAS TT8 TaxID=3447453 RepID=UPI003F528706
MRTLKIVVALLVVVAGLAGCSLFGGGGSSQDEQIQQYLDENAQFTVFLRDDVTDAQRKDVEAALRALPDVAEVAYEDKAAAFQRFAQLYSAEPDLVSQVSKDALPESFRVRMADNAAIRKVRAEDTVKNLPGVNKTVFTCTTVQECREFYAKKPSPQPS